MTARTVALAFLVALASVGLAACPGQSFSPTRTSKNDAIVTIRCNVADAELWVDDRFVSEVGNLRRGVALDPGEHRIELRHDSYHTQYTEITVSAREQRTLAIELIEVLP